MRKLISLLLSLFPFVGLYGEPEIELAQTLDPNEQKTEIPVFHAEVNQTNSVSVSTEQPSTFCVSIYDATNTTLLYQGSTYVGYCHFTSTLPSGSYYIVISGLGYSYDGEFEISND